ncbi:MAG: DUF3369 domain-containing protein [Desulfobacteraceae bacterium]|nr:DUF3369 domain-containing protein [Desulfobacteraceae bacterium]
MSNSFQAVFPKSASWKVLIVDDEPDVHTITKLSLKNFVFADRTVEFLHAMSGAEAREIIRSNSDIAAVVIDVVMETEDAGLQLVKFIREEVKNRDIRLVIRTGQPGVAPEKYVIDHYDIDDYKDKTELVAQKLYTTIRSAIKAYRDISIISRNRHGLEKILNSAPQLYRLQPMEEFFKGVLMQIIGLCHLGENNLISVNGFIAVENEEQVTVQAGTGRFAESIPHEELEKIKNALHTSERVLPQGSLLIPLKIHGHTRGFIYLEDARLTHSDEWHLIEIMVQQCAAAFENLDLYQQLEIANKLNERKTIFWNGSARSSQSSGGILMVFDMIRMSDSECLSQDSLDMLKLGASQAEYAINIISDLLDIAKIESGKLELDFKLINLSDIIRQSIAVNHFMSESKHIRVILEDQDKIWCIDADKQKILQVFINLISNALKYSDSDTSVRIAVHKTDDQMILISVTDEGRGIPPNDIGKLFQPFVKADVKATGGEQSTGLGLVICKKIIEAHGGRIWVDSELGKGSILFVALPSRK